jgi:DNA-binding MarR family transcriptional regulator
MTSVAKDLDITVGTLTIAINSLVKKDYVKRIRSPKDRRVVLISLSPKGQKAYKHHKNFHENMIAEIHSIINEEETIILTKTLKSIYSYFINKYPFRNK